MTMQQFIDENREELRLAIRAMTKREVPLSSLDDKELRLWILNEEGLYNWARSEGVRI